MIIWAQNMIVVGIREREKRKARGKLENIAKCYHRTEICLSALWCFCSLYLGLFNFIGFQDHWLMIGALGEKLH